MSFKSVQGKLQKQGHSKEVAGKILGAAAQKAKHPSPNQQKVLKAQGKKKRPLPHGFGHPARKPHGIGDKPSGGFEKFRRAKAS